jgi:hypothetical protein
MFISGSASSRNRRVSPSTKVFFMQRLASLVTAAALATSLLAGTAFAQTPAPAAKDSTATESKAPAEKKQRSAASLDCSKQADAKGLHGKERKKFRSECKKEASAPAAKQ